MASGTKRLGRRGFLRAGAALGAASAFPFVFGYQRAARADGYGALVPDPAGVLDLPPGFSYVVLQRIGEPMSDGHRVPGRPDAMAAFPGPKGEIILMRNHELSLTDAAFAGPYYPDQEPAPEAYDGAAPGGVTRVVVDPETLAVKSSNLVLVGTLRNCAGGPSPWGWISCEETVDPGHGFAFVCRTDAEVVQPPQRISGYGRYRHEAACVHPQTRVAYLTEDRDDGCLYRFVPADVSDPFTGTLQALRVVGEPVYATTNMAVGERRAIEWIDVPEPVPTGDTVRSKCHALGAAVIVRGEGIWFHEGAVYVASTSGGPIGAGQIFRVEDRLGGASIELIARSEDAEVLSHPDNITLAPWGHLYLVEDSGGDNHVRVVTPAGELFDFARNVLSNSEMCGVCFSPDGSTMFVNIQGDGLTLAIRGPFLSYDGDSGSGSGGGSEGPWDASTGAGSASGGGGLTSDPGEGGGPTGGTESSSDGAETAPVGLEDPATGCACDARASGVQEVALAGLAAGALRRGRSRSGEGVGEGPGEGGELRGASGPEHEAVGPDDRDVGVVTVEPPVEGAARVDEVDLRGGLAGDPDDARAEPTEEGGVEGGAGVRAAGEDGEVGAERLV